MVQLPPEKLLMSQGHRPPDERIETVSSLLQQTKRNMENSQRLAIDLSKCSLHAQADRLMLESSNGNKAFLTQFSYRQLCDKLQAPASFLDSLNNPYLAADIINQTIQNQQQHGDLTGSALIRQKGRNLVLSGLNSTQYAQVWDHNLYSMVSQCTDSGWELAHECAAYLSDHNSFAFFINPNKVIDDGSKDGLIRGFIVGNSEVGERSVQIISFLLRGVCSNLQIFGMQGIEDIRISHIGDADKRVFNRIHAELDRFCNAPCFPAESLIKKATRKVIGKRKSEVINTLYARQIGPKHYLEKAWKIGEIHADTDGAPTNVWGMFQALTRLSQETPYGDARLKMDRDAGRVLALAN